MPEEVYDRSQSEVIHIDPKLILDEHGNVFERMIFDDSGSPLLHENFAYLEDGLCFLAESKNLQTGSLERRMFTYSEDGELLHCRIIEADGLVRKIAVTSSEEVNSSKVYLGVVTHPDGRKVPY